MIVLWKMAWLVVGMAYISVGYNDYAKLHRLLPNLWVSAFSPLLGFSIGCAIIVYTLFF